ncbi:MAG: hypothetical protein KME27_26755 [Lyngbya sp. HA4199-MV5]|nr:hypothetical protein [Lyngbya sp. HA4199-MV5]
MAVQFWFGALVALLPPQLKMGDRGTRHGTQADQTVGCVEVLAACTEKHDRQLCSLKP